MNQIKGTPAYWKIFQGEVLAMIRQLGCPTFFLTLSSAELHWNELIAILTQLNGSPLSEEQINNLSYHERCEILNQNPVFVARHFQYRVVEVFFTEILMSCGPLGKVKYYAHAHSFVWILNPPILSKHNIANYIKFVHSMIQATLPNYMTKSSMT